MTDELHRTIPAVTPPLLSVEAQLEQFRRWIEGYTDEKNVHHPGIRSMVVELYEEAKLRRERREAFGRAIASGGVLAVVGLMFTWLKDHLK